MCVRVCKRELITFIYVCIYFFFYEHKEFAVVFFTSGKLETNFTENDPRSKSGMYKRTVLVFENDLKYILRIFTIYNTLTHVFIYICVCIHVYTYLIHEYIVSSIIYICLWLGIK